jgi:sec-independent protein translocase protein TatC
MSLPKEIDKSKREFAEMGLLEHLGELRNRLIIVSVTVLIFSCVAYSYSAEILELLFRPFFQHFDKGMLIGTGPAEAFTLKIKVAMFVGVIISSPVIFLQLWLFITPGMYDHEKKMLIPFVASATFLFLSGVVFCNQVVFPFAFDFFKDQYDSIPHITPAIKVDEHLSMIIQGLLGFGIVFEMPVLAYFLAKIGLIDHKMMLNSSRYAIVAITIISAVFTPPDVITMFLMAVPLLGLYALSILVVWMTESRKPAAESQ